VAGEEGVGEGQAGDSRHQGNGSVDEPDDAERPHLAGVVLQLELQAGHRGDRRHCRAATLWADPCPGAKARPHPLQYMIASSKKPF
jgi:hypothetical protein